MERQLVYMHFSYVQYVVVYQEFSCTQKKPVPTAPTGDRTINVHSQTTEVIPLLLPFLGKHIDTTVQRYRALSGSEFLPFLHPD